MQIRRGRDGRKKMSPFSKPRIDPETNNKSWRIAATNSTTRKASNYTMLKNWIHHFPLPLLFIKKNTCKIGRECTAIFHNIKSSRQSFRSCAQRALSEREGIEIEVEGFVRAILSLSLSLSSSQQPLFNPLSRSQTLICLTYEREPPFPKYTRSPL